MDLPGDGDFTIQQLARALRLHKLSPVELTRFYLDRISSINPRLNAFITITDALALRQARKAEAEIMKGNLRSPLHGIPMTLKDLISTKGVATTGGSRILRHSIPERNAAIAERLFQGGAVLLGKTNLHEFAFGATSDNPHFGPVRNPWDLRRVAGGSSGGSAAAVAARLCTYSIGTDTGGSIRIPAAACGCVGFKPAYGVVPLDGVIPLSFSLDHAGPICNSVEDAALVYSWISGRRLKLAAGKGSVPLRGLRIGVPREFFFDRLHPDVRACVGRAIDSLRRSGAAVREVSISGLDETADIAGTITVAEALAYHQRWLDSRPGDYGEDLRMRMTDNRNMSAVDYLQAAERRRAYEARFHEAFLKVDVIVSPTLPVVAPMLGDTDVLVDGDREDVRLTLLRLTRPGNLAGVPAISVPCGFTRDDLPVGLQIMGPKGGEAAVFRAAREVRIPS